MGGRVNVMVRLLVPLVVAILLIGFSGHVLARPVERAAYSQKWYIKLGGGRVIESSLNIADLDGDGSLEILVGTTGASGSSSWGRPTRLEAYKDRGTFGELLWSVDPGAPIKSSPTVGVVCDPGDGSEHLAVVVSIGGDTDPLPWHRNEGNYHGGVMAYEAATGNLLWAFWTRDDLPEGVGDGYTDGVYSTPTIGDIDGDGKNEIAFGGWDRWFYMLNCDGTKRWEFGNSDTYWSSPALADLNKDGKLEIIVGADIYQWPSSGNGGFLEIFDYQGNVLLREWYDQTVWSSPAVGDLDGDGWLEIVAGTGLGGASELGHQVRIWDHNGNLLHTMITNGKNFSSPALADLDGDGDLEIVIASAPTQEGGRGRIYAWHHTGSLVSGFPSQDYLPMWSSPTVGDVDGDGALEILFTQGWSVFVMSASGVEETSLQANYTTVGSPAIGDIDGDGTLEIMTAGSWYGDDGWGYLYVWNAGPSADAELPWPMFHHDAQHTGLYSRPPCLGTHPDSLYVMHEYGSGSSEDRTLMVSNGGEGAIEWEVSDHPVRVSVAPDSGEADQTGQSVGVSISTSGLATDTYDLGKITLTGTVGGEPVEGSPFDVAVTLYVGHVHKIFLPIVVRNKN